MKEEVCWDTSGTKKSALGAKLSADSTLCAQPRAHSSHAPAFLAFSTSLWLLFYYTPTVRRLTPKVFSPFPIWFVWRLGAKPYEARGKDFWCALRTSSSLWLHPLFHLPPHCSRLNACIHNTLLVVCYTFSIILSNWYICHIFYIQYHRPMSLPNPSTNARLSVHCCFRGITLQLGDIAAIGTGGYHRGI